MRLAVPKLRLATFAKQKTRNAESKKKGCVIKSAKEMIYGISKSTRGRIGADFVRADHRCLSLLYSAALATDILFKIGAF